MFYYYTIRIFLISPLLVLQRRILGSFKAGPVKNNMRLQTETDNRLTFDGQKRLKNSTCEQDNKFCFAIKHGNV